MADEKNTGEKWMDFFFGEPKRTVIILVSILTVIVLFSPELKANIIKSLSELMTSMIMLALVLLGFYMIWSKVFGKKS